ncbi:MAG: trypsin-like peptidase domain-containing protein [Jatrophihabitantaceae bacterium]
MSNDQDFTRPDGVGTSFAPRTGAAVDYTPPPRTVSPEEQAVFGRPAGVESFAPLPGERLPPRTSSAPPVPQMLAQAFDDSGAAVDGFDPAPGTRLSPSGAAPPSPWWKADAQHDPWRDPASPFWLGRGAVFTRGQPAQLEPDADSEASEDADDDDADERAQPEPSTGSRRARFGLNAILLTTLIALLAGAIGGGAGYWLTKRTNNVLHRDNVSLATTDQPANRPPGSVADIAKRVGPAVVSITVTTSTVYAVGSGVVIDKDGDVLTNNHVIADAATGTDASITVTFSDEATAKAQIVGRDPVSDIAVLKVPSTQLTVAALGDSDKLAVGDPVVAIGSPLGLEGTVTAGIVSALGRAVHVFSDDGSSDAYLNAVQTDAAINPGNSGGALVDAAGAVVGINSAGRFSTTDATGQSTPVSGIGYAIPINYARTIAEELIKTGKATHASLGAQGRSVTDGSQLGAYLEQVAPGGPAAKAGLQNGDVIVVAAGHRIVSYDQLAVIIQAEKPGARITVTYLRKAAKKDAQVVLGAA